MNFSDLQKGDKIFFISKVDDVISDIENETVRLIREKNNRIEILTVEDNYYWVSLENKDKDCQYIKNDVFEVYMFSNDKIAIKKLNELN